jgi:hypothetical protein
MLTAKEARSELEARGITVSRSNFALLLRKGHVPGAELTETPRGPAWLVPVTALSKFKLPGRGWPKGKPRKAASAKSPAKRARSSKVA